MNIHYSVIGNIHTNSCYSSGVHTVCGSFVQKVIYKEPKGFYLDFDRAIETVIFIGTLSETRMPAKEQERLLSLETNGTGKP